MGRFGNVILVGGETDLSLAARAGEVIRFYLTNTANTRVFNVALPGARIKLVGGDSGRYEREGVVDSVILAPSERVVIDALFSDSGRLTLEHRTPERRYTLATIDVGTQPAEPALAEQFGALRHNPEWVAERERLAPCFDAPPDKTLGLVAEMGLGTPEGPVVSGSESGERDLLRSETPRRQGLGRRRRVARWLGRRYVARRAPMGPPRHRGRGMASRARRAGPRRRRRAGTHHRKRKDRECMDVERRDTRTAVTVPCGTT